MLLTYGIAPWLSAVETPPLTFPPDLHAIPPRHNARTLQLSPATPCGSSQGLSPWRLSDIAAALLLPVRPRTAEQHRASPGGMSGRSDRTPLLRQTRPAPLPVPSSSSPPLDSIMLRAASSAESKSRMSLS